MNMHNVVVGPPLISSIPFGNIVLTKDWLIKADDLHFRRMGSMEHLINQGIVKLVPASGMSAVIAYRNNTTGNDEYLTDEIIIAQGCIPSVMSIKVTGKLQRIGIKFFKKYGNVWNGGFYLKNMEALQGLEYKVYTP